MGEGRNVPSGAAYDTQRALALSARDRTCGVPPAIPLPSPPLWQFTLQEGTISNWQIHLSPGSALFPEVLSFYLIPPWIP